MCGKIGLLQMRLHVRKCQIYTRYPHKLHGNFPSYFGNVYDLKVFSGNVSNCFKYWSEKTRKYLDIQVPKINPSILFRQLSKRDCDSCHLPSTNELESVSWHEVI